MVAYISAAFFKAAIFPDGTEDTADDLRIQLALDAGKALIDSFCGREFGTKTEANVTKTFEARYTDWLEIPDLQTLTSITLDTDNDRTYATTLSGTTDYDLWPLDGPPYTQIRLRSTTSYGFYAGLMLRITGAWGYASTTAVPAAIQQANLLISNRLFRRQKDAPFGVIQMVDQGEIARIQKVDPDVEQLLGPYSRNRNSTWAIA